MLCVSLNKKQRPGQQREVGGGKRSLQWEDHPGQSVCCLRGQQWFRNYGHKRLVCSVTPVCQGCPGDCVKVLLWFSVISSFTELWYNRACRCPSTLLEKKNPQHTELTVWLLSTLLLLFPRHASIQHVSSKAIWRTWRRQYFRHASFVCCDNVLCFS